VDGVLVQKLVWPFSFSHAASLGVGEAGGGLPLFSCAVLLLFVP
jgi:hypothetical protein